MIRGWRGGIAGADLPVESDPEDENGLPFPLLRMGSSEDVLGFLHVFSSPTLDRFLVLEPRLATGGPCHLCLSISA